jgi:MFS family permease
MLIATLAGVYMASQALRNSISVIAPNLMAEIGLSASQLGLLSSVFFFSFAAAQVPLGIALDRFGPKLCMLACTGIVIVGAGLFAMAQDPTTLILARILLGVGGSCYLMAPLAFFARHFPPARFPVLAGIHMGLGTTGTLLATAPLALSTAAIGWRATFWLIAGVMMIGAAMVAVAVPGERPRLLPNESLRANLAGTLRAIRLPSVTRLFLMQFASFSSFALIIGLWGGPYLTHVYGYGLVERGDLLFLAAGGQVIGLLLNGPMERWLGGYKPPVLLGAAFTGILLATLAAVGELPRALLLPWLFIFGAASAYTPTLIAHGKSLFPQELTGRGLTWLNIGSMGGAFVTQLISGAVIDLFPISPEGAYPVSAYRAVFGLQATFIAVALWFYCRASEPAPGKT